MPTWQAPPRDASCYCKSNQSYSSITTLPFACDLGEGARQNGGEETGKEASPDVMGWGPIRASAETSPLQLA